MPANSDHHKEHDVMADLEQVELLRSSISEWNLWRKMHPKPYPDLDEANLFNANLTGADLHIANLNHALLVGADLTGADLTSANLNRAELHSANLSGAKLYYTNLSFAKLHKAIFTDVSFLCTIFVGVDLSNVK